MGNFFGGGYTNWPGEGKKLGSRVNQLLYGGMYSRSLKIYQIVTIGWLPFGKRCFHLTGETD